MGQFYAGGIMLAVFAAIGSIFIVGYNSGKIDGKSFGEVEIRDKVVVYCIEKPQLCKEEYQNIKTQNKLNTYQKPEIE